MVPHRTVALGQQRVQHLISQADESLTRFGYGVLLHVRKERTRATLGLITLTGEALPLTARMLASIIDTPILLAGHTRVTLSLLDNGASAEPDRALDALVMQVLPAASPPPDFAEAHEVTAGIDALVCADTLLQPLVFLLPARPAGWPR